MENVPLKKWKKPFLLFSFVLLCLTSCDKKTTVSLKDEDIKGLKFGEMDPISCELFEFDLKKVSYDEVIKADKDSLRSSLLSIVNQTYGSKKRLATMDDPTPVLSYTYDSVRLALDESGDRFIWAFLLQDDKLQYSDRQDPLTLVYYQKVSSISFEAYYSDSYAFIKPFISFFAFLGNSFSSAETEKGTLTNIYKI
jgi:hypothetical protein